MWFFGLAWRGVKTVCRIVHQNGLTDADLVHATALVESASAHGETMGLPDNPSRRDWAVSELTKSGVRESLARFAVEAAVQVVKARRES